ncbi:MAG: sigma-70 family RNA polymerase sigma factor [Polyangiaceae bacterium]
MTGLGLDTPRRLSSEQTEMLQGSAPQSDDLASATTSDALATTSSPRSPKQQDLLRELVTTHFNFVWRNLRRVGNSPADSDEIVQEAFLVAARKLDEMRAGCERAFLLAIAMNIASTRRRSYSREVLRIDRSTDSLTPQPLLDPEQAIEQQQARRELDAVLSEMSLELKTVFVLYELEELNTREIAELLDLKEGTVASRLRRARGRISRDHRSATSPDHQDRRRSPMTTERLLDTGTNEERRLLTSALADDPSERAQRRMLLLLGVDPTLCPEPVSATHVAAPKPIGAHRGSEVLPKTVTPSPTSLSSLVTWIGIAGVAIGIGVGTGFLARPFVHARLDGERLSVETAPSRVTTAAKSVAPLIAEAVAAPAAAEAAATLPLPPPRAPTGRVANVTQPKLETGIEVQLVDRARLALREGDAQTCLQHLDERKRRVGAGMLGPEATLLRIQALLALNRRTTALDEARRFLELCPDGPIAERIQAVVGKSTATNPTL